MIARCFRLDDRRLSGGAEATICELGVGGFCAMRALSTARNACVQVMTPGMRFMQITSAFGPFLDEAG